MCAAIVALVAAGPSSGQTTRRAPHLRATRLLALKRGQTVILLGPYGQWLPESGVPTTLTLLSGPPRAPNAAGETAYVALQRGAAACPRRAPATAQLFPAYYVNAHLISRHPGSPFSGAQPGDYAATINRLTVTQTGSTRACVWVGVTALNARLVHTQLIPLLNGLFAASVSTLASAGSTAAHAYTLDAVDVGTPFSYAVTTGQCSSQYQDASGKVPDGELATESITLTAHPCPTDGSQFSFSSATGTAIGVLDYTVAQATASPPVVAALGGCEFDPVADTTVAEATAYVTAVGCTVHRLIAAPYQRGFAHGAVLGAQVDGGNAEVAPHGMAINLLLNGTP